MHPTKVRDAARHFWKNKDQNKRYTKLDDESYELQRALEKFRKSVLLNSKHCEVQPMEDEEEEWVRSISLLLLSALPFSGAVPAF